VLKAQASEGKIVYVFRHIAEELEGVLNLSGYGVELAIKSLEYKTVDDTKVEGLCFK
jgi:UDP-glucose:glycoprotein glucosyltransferase